MTVTSNNSVTTKCLDSHIQGWLDLCAVDGKIPTEKTLQDIAQITPLLETPQTAINYLRGEYPQIEQQMNQYGRLDPLLRNQMELLFSLVHSSELSIDSPLDYQAFKSIHKRLFDDLYVSAGKARLLNASKQRSQFVVPDCIQQAVERELKEMHQTLGQKPLSFERFCLELAHHFNEFNMIHPFQGGNGIALRALFSLIAAKNYYALDWGQTNQQIYLQACEVAFHGDHEPLEHMFLSITESVV